MAHVAVNMQFIRQTEDPSALTHDKASGGHFPGGSVGS